LSSHMHAFSLPVIESDSFLANAQRRIPVNDTRPDILSRQEGQSPSQPYKVFCQICGIASVGLPPCHPSVENPASCLKAPSLKHWKVPSQCPCPRTHQLLEMDLCMNRNLREKVIGAKGGQRNLGSVNDMTTARGQDRARFHGEGLG
jgi:hypothetical protein